MCSPWDRIRPLLIPYEIDNHNRSKPEMKVDITIFMIFSMSQNVLIIEMHVW